MHAGDSWNLEEWSTDVTSEAVFRLFLGLSTHVHCATTHMPYY